MKKEIKAVVVLSGGQDSAICLALACKKYGQENIAAITFSYGQRHSIETKYASRLAKRFSIAKHKIMKLDFFSSITSSALLDNSSPITKKKGSSCPTSVVEGRNAFFLLAAGVWAKELGAKEIWTGVSQTDFSGYPDCRKAFISAQQKAMRLAMEWPFSIKTPFMNISKKDEWEIADNLGILDLVQNETVTCYHGIPGRGCKKCPACKLRNQALDEYLETRKH
jgi:7-cyano-7-deazaguanine synthase